MDSPRIEITDETLPNQVQGIPATWAYNAFSGELMVRDEETGRTVIKDFVGTHIANAVTYVTDGLAQLGIPLPEFEPSAIDEMETMEAAR